MITLYGFSPDFGLPDPSPFVIKAEVLLKMAGLPYRMEAGDLSKAPKGKIPYMDDAGTIVPDSTFMRFHLENRHNIDFDTGLSPADKGVAWACEKLCEDQLYWVVVRERWLDDANFHKGPRKFFDKAPALIRPLIIPMIRRKVRQSLHGQGIGRHSLDEMNQLATRGLASVAAVLGDKPWLIGNKPCGADASVWASIACILCPHFDTASRVAANKHANLVAYRDRGMATWFPDLKAGSSATTA